jgi:hypothetical protein
MATCPKCGSRVRDDMAFCPNCGASLRAEQTATQQTPPPPPRYRNEKAEKDERNEKREKGEKHEKRGPYGFIGPLIGGLVLIFIGMVAVLSIYYNVRSDVIWALFFIIIGILVIIGAIYGATMARRRYPRT